MGEMNVNDEEEWFQPSPEAALLVECLREQPIAAAREADCQTFLHLALAHGVLDLVCQAFLQQKVALPDSLRAALQETGVVAERYATELESLLAHFARRGIEVIALKGPVLAKSLYGGVTRRTCDDLDLLVRRENFPQAEALLLEAGAVPQAAADDYHRKFHRNGIPVELHFALASPRSFRFDSARVWSCSAQESFREQPVRVMADDDLVLFLCLHGLKHGFSRLIWIMDIARALAGMRDSSAAQLFQKARRLGLEQVLLTGCEIVRETVPHLMRPDIDHAAARHPEAARRARQTIEWLFAERAGANNDPEIWGLYLQTEDSMSGRWRRRLSFLLPTVRDHQLLRSRRLPGGFAPLIRPVRLLGKYGPARAWRILFPRQS